MMTLYSTVGGDYLHNLICLENIPNDNFGIFFQTSIPILYSNYRGTISDLFHQCSWNLSKLNYD